jgi:hypothetical protein
LTITAIPDGLGLLIGELRLENWEFLLALKEIMPFITEITGVENC